MKYLYSLCLFFIGLLVATAQEGSCATDEVHQLLMQSDKVYAENIRQQTQKWSEHVKRRNRTVATAEDPGIYQIPVVFHVLHTGQQVGVLQNPYNFVFTNLVSELNQKFSATWPAFPSENEGGVPIPIQFKLAERTPDCQPTNGINRINASDVPGYTSYGIAYGGSEVGANALTLKSLSRWPNTEYLNIWVVHNIVGGWAGFANYPGASADSDGIVLKANGLSWALTHEVGHFLGIRHTFNGSSGSICPPNDDCTVDGDFVCDTDPHTQPNNCPTGLNVCSGSSYAPVIYNIMSYSSCPDRFSEGQRDRMIFFLEQYRYALSTSLGDESPDFETEIVGIPISACIPPANSSPGSMSDIGARSVILGDLQYSSAGYTFDNFMHYIDNTTAPDCMTQPQAIAHLDPSIPHVLTVSTGYNPEVVRTWIDFNNTGTFESDEVIMTSYGSLSFETHIAEFSIPESAVLNTPLRMRVASDYQTLPEACSPRNYGQTEDFPVILTENLSSGSHLAESFDIYPNPVKDELVITAPTGISMTYQIYELTGKLVVTGSLTGNTNVDLSMLSSGFYLIRVGSEIKKLVKQ